MRLVFMRWDRESRFHAVVRMDSVPSVETMPAGADSLTVGVQDIYHDLSGAAGSGVAPIPVRGRCVGNDAARRA